MKDSSHLKEPDSDRDNADDRGDETIMPEDLPSAEGGAEGGDNEISVLTRLITFLDGSSRY